MLEGQPFTFYTEHKPLAYALGKLADGWTAMQCQQLSYVVEFTTDIRHVPGVLTHSTGHLPTPKAVPTPPDQIATQPELCLLCLLFQSRWTMLALPRIS
jgi:hypothetical protein